MSVGSGAATPREEDFSNFDFNFFNFFGYENARESLGIYFCCCGRRGRSWNLSKHTHTHTEKTEQTVLQEEEEKEEIKNEDDEEKPNRQSNVLLRRRKIEATTVSSRNSRNSFQFGQPKYSAQSLPVRRGRTRGGGRQRPLLFSVFESLALSVRLCFLFLTFCLFRFSLSFLPLEFCLSHFNLALIISKLRSSSSTTVLRSH